MKKITLIILLSVSVFTLKAQIATREADSVSYKFGTRPKKGDMALMMAIPLKDSSLKSGTVFNMLNLADNLFIKWYCTDRNVFRLSASAHRQGETLKGVIADSSAYNPIIKPHVKDITQKLSALELIIKPGMERHVKASNVFDVYGGADLWIGYGHMNALNNISMTNGNYSDMQVVSNYGILGLNAFAGVNIFIAKLPLSLGLEYGWNGATVVGYKAKVSRQDQQMVGATPVAVDADYFTQLVNKDLYGVPDNNLYGTLTRNASNWGSNNTIKLTVNFYFNK
jgi:hypothetical protein